MQIKDRRSWNIFSVVLVIIGAAWTLASAAPPGTTTSGKIPAPQTGFLAPDFTLQTAEGEEYTLSELRGKGVLLNLWASWCGPCRQEMPAMQAIYDRYRDDGFIVLAVNVTSQDSESAALAFAREYELNFPILMDRDGAVARLYNQRAFPTSFFIGPDGIIQEVIIGGPMAEALLEVRAAQLLEGIDN